MLDLYTITEPGRDIAAGHRGVPEPGLHCPRIDRAAIDFVLVPGVAFDLEGRRLGYGGLALMVVVTGLFMAAHVAWYVRLFVFLPAVVGSVSLLQVRRNTCVSRAREGTFEHEDGSTTPMEDADARASRKVAAGIRRDGFLVAAACAALAAATSFVI